MSEVNKQTHINDEIESVVVGSEDYNNFLLVFIRGYQFNRKKNPKGIILPNIIELQGCRVCIDKVDPVITEADYEKVFSKVRELEEALKHQHICNAEQVQKLTDKDKLVKKLAEDNEKLTGRLVELLKGDTNEESVRG